MSATLRLGAGLKSPTPRRAAFDLLTKAGFPSGTMTTNVGIVVPIRVVMVATAEIESDLYVDAVGPPNADDSTDRGWLQLNSVHGYDNALLVADPLYTAKMAYEVWAKQGVSAWAAYSKRWLTEDPPYRYLRRMPPAWGGPDIVEGQTNERLRSVQEFLNEAGLGLAPLTQDGGFGPKTKLAVLEWKRRHHNDGTATVNGGTWMAMVARGLS